MVGGSGLEGKQYWVFYLRLDENQQLVRQLLWSVYYRRGDRVAHAITNRHPTKLTFSVAVCQTVHPSISSSVYQSIRPQSYLALELVVSDAILAAGDAAVEDADVVVGAAHSQATSKPTSSSTAWAFQQSPAGDEATHLSHAVRVQTLQGKTTFPTSEERMDPTLAQPVLASSCCKLLAGGEKDRDDGLAKDVGLTKGLESARLAPPPMDTHHQQTRQL